MSGEIASAFVRIRPDTHGFQAEAEHGIKGALTSVGKTLGGIFAVTGAIEGIKSLGEAATEHQTSFAILDRTITNAHASLTLYGQGIEAVLEKEARLKGFNEEGLAGGFARLVGVTHDSAKAFKDLALAEDIARARHIEVERAALGLARAEQGNVSALTRITGIVIPKYTVAVTQLTHEHDRLVAAGVKFTKQQELQYKAQLANAAALDASTRKAQAFSLVQEQFAGVATHSGEASAKIARFQVEMHQLSVAVGTALLPAIGQAADTLIGWIEELRGSDDAAVQARKFISDLGSAFHTLADAGHLAATVLGPVAKVVIGLAEIAGPGNLLGIAIALKGVGIATSLAASGWGRLTTAAGAFVGVGGTAAGVAGASAAPLGEVAIAANAAATAQFRLALGTGAATKAFEAESIAAAAAARSAGGAAAAGGLGGVLGRSVGLNPVIQAGIVTGLVLEHFKQKAKSAQDEAEASIAKTGTARAAALAFYTQRVEALVASGMKRTTAKVKAELDTIAHLHIAIHPGSGVDDLAKNVEDKAKAAAAHLDVALKAVNSNIVAAKSTLATAAQELALANQNLAETIRNGNQQITDSIRSAESNLASIGDSLASTIDEFMQKVGGGTAASPESAAFKRLRDQIATGSEAPGARAAASALANQLQQSQAVQADRAQSAKRQIADLVAEFNQGSITLATFNKRVAGLLAKDGISYKRAGQVLGIAFAQGFRAQVEGLREQAAAIAATPGSRRPGLTGQEPNIVRPLETIHQVQLQIAAAQRARDEKALEVQRDTRRLTSLETQRSRLLLQQSGASLGVQRRSEGHLKTIAGESKKQTRLTRQQLRAQRQAARGAGIVGAAVAAADAAAVAGIGGP